MDMLSVMNKAESEETFTLQENKSGQLMDEVIKGLQNASLSSHYLASTSNDQVEYHPQNVGMDSEQNEGYDYGLSTKTIYPTNSIVINGIKEKKRVGRIRQPKRVLNGKKKKQKSKGEDRDEISITQSDNAQHSLNISQNHCVQEFTHSNYQCNIPFILPNNQLGSVSASSLLNLVHTLPTLSNSQIDLQQHYSITSVGGVFGWNYPTPEYDRFPISTKSIQIAFKK